MILNKRHKIETDMKQRKRVWENLRKTNEKFSTILQKNFHLVLSVNAIDSNKTKWNDDNLCCTQKREKKSVNLFAIRLQSEKKKLLFLSRLSNEVLVPYILYNVSQSPFHSISTAAIIDFFATCNSINDKKISNKNTKLEVKVNSVGQYKYVRER